MRASCPNPKAETESKRLLFSLSHRVVLTSKRCCREMKPQTQRGFGSGPVLQTGTCHRRLSALPEFPLRRHGDRFIRRFSIRKRNHINLSVRSTHIPPEKPESSDSTCVNLLEHVDSSDRGRSTRRNVLVVPLLGLGVRFLHSAPAKAEEKVSVTETAATEMKTVTASPAPKPEEQKTKEEDVILSRIYDATVIGEPMALGKDKRKVWEKIMDARIVYLGEAEQVPIRDDKELELEIVRNLRKRCIENDRKLSLALEAFPSHLQGQLNQYMDKSWQEYEPLLSYCRDNEVRLIACGTPLKVLRTVQSEGIQGLKKADRKVYAPPPGSGFISGFTSRSHRSPADMNSPNQSVPFGPSSYLSAQARVVEDYAMSQIILQNMLVGGATSMLVVVTGASHVTYGSRGTGVPARISRKMQKKNQVVILLDPERQQIRREGEVPVADFLWYSSARPCNRNCFDRAEIARVMNAAGRRRDALPQDIQKGLDLGLVSPEVLQNFFDLEKYPLISELTHRFQGFRERLLADPNFLHRLAIEEAISITTTLLAQYERRKENFVEELDYVITDTVRGIVVDFFTVWLPAPTLSFLSYSDEMNMPDNMDSLKGLIGSIPDNAFQKSLGGREWNLNHRVASVLLGGFKLASVGFISSIGAVAASNFLYALRRFLTPVVVNNEKNRRSPMLKTAVVYACFLGTSANLRYQIIAGIVEHRISDKFSSETLLVNMLSFIVRTINSYWGTQQWVDLARSTGLQTRKVELPSYEKTGPPTNHATVGSNKTKEANVDEIKNQ
ncbi:protein RETICULATA-RELATED 5, chloroplastic-like [Quillaja saponaria]|uniref:Protein RETICULATA-RELATED 5, chloroplastic-like n=1 Tax=Quillaja saponaria TaxID=32244 RepID=A0AAD7LT79_QUISA|nr:protein RETICULATA-RELATED 5, chloroplastic-like [Quillaja saponaria]